LGGIHDEPPDVFSRATSVFRAMRISSGGEALPTTAAGYIDARCVMG
jgi:hypothetical protein